MSLFSGNAVAGVLTETPGEFLIMRAAQVLEPGMNPARVDGEIVIEQANVDYVQITGNS